MKKSTLLSKLTVAGLLLTCSAGLLAQPTAAAPTPTTLDADKVFTVFSDVNNPISGVTYHDWSGGANTATTTENIDSNNTLKMSSLGAVGITFNQSDISTMEFMRIDVWCASTINLKISLVTGNDTDGDKSEKEFVASVATANAWNSIEIPLANYPDLNFAKFGAIKISDNDWGGKTIYADNIYFYSTGIEAAPTPDTYTTSNAIFSDVNTSVGALTYHDWGGNGAKVSPFKIGDNNTLRVTNFAATGITFTEFDASANTKLHIDVWTPGNISNFGIYLITDMGGNKKEPGKIVQLQGNQWNSINIDLSEYTGTEGFDLTKLGGMKLTDNDWGNKTIYIDNIYLYKENATSIKPENKIEFRTYPNPVVNELHITAQENIEQVNILNMIGQAVKSVDVNANSATININDVPQGTYFVKIKSANGASTTQKIIKQ